MVATFDTIPQTVENEITESAVSRDHLIGHILLLNPTADRLWLARFSPAALHIYLEHLQAAAEPRGRMARWLRPGDTPAIVGYIAGDD